MRTARTGPRHHARRLLVFLSVFVVHVRRERAAAEGEQDLWVARVSAQSARTSTGAPAARKAKDHHEDRRRRQILDRMRNDQHLPTPMRATPTRVQLTTMSDRRATRWKGRVAREPHRRLLLVARGRATSERTGEPLPQMTSAGANELELPTIYLPLSLSLISARKEQCCGGHKHAMVGLA